MEELLFTSPLVECVLDFGRDVCPRPNTQQSNWTVVTVVK